MQFWRCSLYLCLQLLVTIVALAVQEAVASSSQYLALYLGISVFPHEKMNLASTKVEERIKLKWY